MRKILFLAFISLSFLACEDVVEPSSVVQGEVNESLFRSNAEAAFNNEGELIIRGSNVDVVTLKTTSNAVGIYEITPNSGNAATYIQDGRSYITSGPDTGGLIEIEEITNSYVTGNFFFEARQNGIGERLNFSKGVFYQVPFSSASTPDEVDEEEDVLSANINGSNFNPSNLTISSTSNSISVSGFTNSGEAINLIFPNPSSPGSYEIGVDDGFGAFYVNNETSETATSGTVEIITFDAENSVFSGTFSFATEEGTTVTNGQFIANF